MKETFLLIELWILTFNAAFQRSNVYAKTDKHFDRGKFKSQLKKEIQDAILPQYHEQIVELQHLKNIKKVSNFAKTLGIEMNFGISQKLLNLYLKYLWCLGEIKTPPHFPVDRIIQQKLNISKPYAWTKMEDREDYCKVIEIAKKRLKTEHDCKNLAELELLLFNRRNMQ